MFTWSVTKIRFNILLGSYLFKIEIYSSLQLLYLESCVCQAVLCSLFPRRCSVPQPPGGWTTNTNIYIYIYMHYERSAYHITKYEGTNVVKRTALWLSPMSHSCNKLYQKCKAICLKWRLHEAHSLTHQYYCHTVTHGLTGPESAYDIRVLLHQNI